MKLALIAVSICLAGVLACSGEAASRETVGLPLRLQSVDGAAIDVKALAERQTVVVITLKATWCPVCQQQLLRIKERLAELEPCGITFIVLAPGPAHELRNIRARTGFPYPFVEDVGLKIARSLGLAMDGGEIAPAILMLNHDRSVGWMQQGRSGRYFGDPELVEKVACWNRV